MTPAALAEIAVPAVALVIAAAVIIRAVAAIVANRPGTRPDRNQPPE